MNVTTHQLDLLHHTLGVRPDRREPFRNHFVAGKGHHDMSDLIQLEAAGYMARRPAPAFCGHGDEVFYVTDAGRDFALDNLPMPPKKTKYDEYLDADYGHSFAEWLGIERPKIEYEYSPRRWRYSRTRYRAGWTEYIEGEWKPTKAEAKASYKAALKKHNDQNRAWRNPGAAA